MFVHCGYDIDEEGDELQILECRFAGAQQIDTRVGTERPIVVLARAVDALERLFVQQYAEMVPACDLVHDCHQQLVVVVSQIGLFENRSQLELIRSNLVVARFNRNTEFETLVLQILHKGEYARRNGTEIVVFQLLILCCLVSHECTPRLYEVRTSRPQRIVDKEILLFPTEIREYALDIFVEITAYFGCRLVYRRQRAQERRFVVQRFARVGDEDGRDAERRIDYECRRGWVPSRIAASLERIADTAVGE